MDGQRRLNGDGSTVGAEEVGEEGSCRSPDLWLQIIAEMEGRRQKGLKDYGVPVTVDETVDWLAHAESEFLDGAVYCRAARLVIEKLRADLKESETGRVKFRDLVDKLLSILPEESK